MNCVMFPNTSVVHHSKHGDAYYVTGCIQDPISVPGPCEVTEFSELRNVREMGDIERKRKQTE